jgi:hypothetical protein
MKFQSWAREFKNTIMAAWNTAHAFNILLEMRDRQSDGSMIGRDLDATANASATRYHLLAIRLGAGLPEGREHEAQGRTQGLLRL